MASNGKSTSRKEPINEPGPSSSEGTGRQPKIESDVEHADEKIAMDGQPGHSTGPMPSARWESERPVDRTQPSLEHQTSTLLTWSLLEQLRLSNEINAEMARMQRLQILMQINAMRGAPQTFDASYFMELLQRIPHAQAPDSVLGAMATASWARLASPNQFLTRLASTVTFAHESFPAVRLNDVTEIFTEAELEMIYNLEAEAQAHSSSTNDVHRESRDTEEASQDPNH